MNQLQFGFSLTPTTDLSQHVELVNAAESGGLDLVGVQDHPYVPGFVETLSLVATMLARTKRIRFFTDVVTLPLRPPAILARTASSLDLLSDGRFELGVGAGGYWDAIATMGVPTLRPADALDALEEAIAIIRALWGHSGPIQLSGKHYQLDGVVAGAQSKRPMGIWVGAQSRRSLALTGRLADGWAAPIPSYLPYEKWAAANALIDSAATAAGRDPSDIYRICQIVGTITDRTGDADARNGDAPVRGTVEQWARLIARLATEQPYRCFIFWPERQSLAQIEKFSNGVVPTVRELLAHRP